MEQSPFFFQSRNILPNFKKNAYEKAAWQDNQIICGIDEVGRGCLAGPVVAAAVILPADKISPLLKDSKLMTEAERLKAFAWIQKNCWYAIGTMHHRIIDQHNIWQATLMAMQKATLHLLAIAPLKPAALLVDAMPLTLTGSLYADIPVYNFIKGESKSSSIAAASIVAKVWRDNLITRMAQSFPGYALNIHKGYATQKHRDSLKTEPISLIHRLSFLNTTIMHSSASNINHQKKEPHEQQQSLC